MALDVELRPVEDDDLPIFFDHQQDPVAIEMAAFPARDRATFDDHLARIRADRSVTFRTILVDGQVARPATSWPGTTREAHVGYWLGREFWGRGIATAALTAFLDEIATRPLFAHVAKHNIGSARVLEKCWLPGRRNRRVEPDGLDEPSFGSARARHARGAHRSPVGQPCSTPIRQRSRPNVT